MATPTLRLISHRLCPYVQRARIVLIEKAIPHDIEFIDLGNKPGWFLEISPLGKVPVLLVDGKPIFESAVIAEYLDEITDGSLHPTQPVEKAVNRSWIEFASNTLAAISNFYNASDEVAFEKATDVLKTRMASLEAALGHGPYFNGSSFSLVDAAFAPVFRYFDVIDLYANFGIFVAAPRVRAWRDALSLRPSVQQAVVDDYSQRLHKFLVARNSSLSRFITARKAA